MNYSRLDLWTFVSVFQFLGQAFVEREKGSFGSAVVNRSRESHEGGQTGNTYNVAFLPGNHIWQELLYGTPLADQINLEQLAETLWVYVKYSVGVSDARVVDQDGGWSKIGTDSFSRLMNLIPRGNVASVVLNELSISYQDC